MRLFNRRLLYTLLVILGFAVAIALIAIKGPLAPVRVETIRLQTGDLHPAVFGVGTVEARRGYDIGPTRPGRLLELAVDEGDAVKKGEVLGKMDPVDLDERLRSAGLVIEKTEHLVEAAMAELDEAIARARQARKEQQRYSKLLAQHQISQEVADQKEADARAAEDRVRQARANLAGVEHDLERARADLGALQAQYDDLRLLSPADGLVTDRLVEPGSVVIAGAPVVKVIEPATLWVRTRIDQARSSAIRAGQPARIELRNRSGALAGHVSRLELIADSLTEERWVDVAFDTIPDDLAIGMLANVTISLPTERNVDWLPGKAIAYRHGEPGVWRAVDGRAEFTPVRIGTRTLDGKTRILDGVNGDDRIVVSASRPLTPGARIREDADRK